MSRVEPGVERALVFTDIEGSTRLVQRLGDGYASLLQQHHELVRAGFERHGGRLATPMGDGFFIVLDDADAALAAATDTQRAIASAAWPADAVVRVRIGMHVGYVEERNGEHLGLAIHQAARVSAAANGGQTLVTGAFAEQIAALPTNVRLEPLGRYRLKDFDEPVPLHELRVPELPGGFAPRAPGVEANNLPQPRTSFVGRGAELRAVTDLLEGATRLVTLLGPGGVGKTRLSFALVEAITERYADGAWVVLLANAAPGTAVGRIQQSLRLRERPDAAPQDAIAEALGERHLLLLLDNCEHLVEEIAAIVDDLLLRCPRVTVLTTSREALRIAGEVEWRLSPMPTESNADGLADAVMLFVQRAWARDPKLTFSPEALDTVATICRSVDGLPLAIELAAGRLRHMTLAGLAAAIGERMKVLALGDRSLEPRQRTVHDLVGWSHDLLSQDARVLFRRMSVFRSAVDRAAVEAVSGAELSDELIDVDLVIAELVDKSMLMLDVGNDRAYRMLVTIRDFASEQLIRAGEADAVSRAHLRWCIGVAQHLNEQLDGPDAESWLSEIDALYDNFTAAMTAGLESGDQPAALELARWLAKYWGMRGRVVEGRSWLERTLTESASLDLRVSGAANAGQLASFCGDLDGARELCTAAIDLVDQARTPEEVTAAAGAHVCLAHVLALVGDTAGGARHFTLARQLGIPTQVGMALNGLGAVAFYEAKYDDAIGYYRQAITAFEHVGNFRNRVIAETNLGEALLALGRYDEAEPILLRSLPSVRSVMRAQLPQFLELLAQLYVALHDIPEAQQWLEEGAALARDMGDVASARRLAGRMAELAPPDDRPAETATGSVTP